MKRFEEFREDSSVLEESLDSAIEYYMTDDTKLPDNIHAAFQIDNTQYLVQIEMSNTPGVYIVNFGRLVNKKIRRYSFYKSSHVRPGIATLMKVLEASVPFLGNRAKAFLLKLPADTNVKKYNRFMEKIIKRSFIKSFRYLPVDDSGLVNTGKKIYFRYAFIARKQVNPHILFKSKKFAGYDFNPKDGIPQEPVEDIAPVRKKPETKSLKPSKTIQFKGFDFETVLDDPDNDFLQSIVDKTTKDDSEGDFASTSSHQTEVPEKSVPKEYVAPGIDNAYVFFVPTSVHSTGDTDVYAATAQIFQDAMKKIEQFGWDDSKFNSSNFLYVLKQQHQTAQLLPEGHPVRELVERYYQKLTNLGIISSDISTVKDEEMAKSLLKFGHMLYWKKKDLIFPKLNNLEEPEIKDPMKAPDDFEAKEIDFGFELKPTLPFSETEWDSDNYWVKNNESVYDKATALYDSGNYDIIFQKARQNPNISGNAELTQMFQATRDYTGTFHSDFNGSLRNAINKDGEFKGSYYIDSYDLQKIMAMNKFFDHMPLTPHSFWVYRNAHLPDGYPWDADEMIIDPGFMSCSLNSHMSLGDHGNTRLKIFVPKGARVIPILQHSKHSSENEVILPPMSLLKPKKVNRTHKGSASKRQVIECIYLGTAKDQLLEKIVSSFKENNPSFEFSKEMLPNTMKESYISLNTQIMRILMSEAPKKPQKEEGNPSKWGPNDATVSAKTMKALVDKIKKGELKIKKK